MRSNQHHQMILNEQDIVEQWLSGKEIKSATVEDESIINNYNRWCDIFDIEHKIDTIEEFIDNSYLDHWYMPEEYKILDLYEYLLEKLPDDRNHGRMMEELYAFEERGMIPVLKFLIYLVDVCKKNNIVLGVGRGSSVASYVLYLIGVHKIDSIKYDLDIKEFLK